MSIIFALLSAFFAALVAIFAKIGLEGSKVDSTTATTLRSLIMFIFLFGISLFTGRITSLKWSEVTGKEWMYIALSGLAGAASWLCYFFALQNGKTSTIVALDRLSLVFTAVIAYFILSEKVGWQEIIGIGLMTVGAVVISVVK